MPLQLSRRDARRVAVRAQLLDADRPTELLATIRHLSLLQRDPTNHVAPSADLVGWSRLGSGYRLGDLDRAEAAGSIVELRGLLRPAEDIALFRAEMAAWPGVGELRDWQEGQRDWVEANDESRREILERLYDDGPLPARAMPDTTAIPWRSSGWNDDRNVRMLVDLMVQRGELAMAGRDGREPLWDLAERVYPDDPVIPLAEARVIRAGRRLHALGIARTHAPEMPGEPNDVGEIGEPAVVDGVRGQWRVDPSYLEGPFRGRTALLSPIDRLIYDRKRMTEIFEFDYQLEMYKPAASRRWGYWAMPILYGDRLVGKLDAAADRRAGVLRINAVHEDEPFSRTLRSAVDREMRDLAGWLDLELDHP